jgi:hypothetical protein
MSWIDDLNNAPDIGSVQRFQPVVRQPQVQQTKKKKGNFLTNLIPSVGGIGGGAAGAAIGTALLPGIGTLIGAGLGSAIGGGGGKVAENAVEGNKLTSGVAGEAALSGVLGAGPLRLGRLGLDTARGLRTVGEAKPILQTVEAARGIPIKSIESVSRGQAGAILPNSTRSANGQLLDPVSFVKRFQGTAKAITQGMPGVVGTALRTGIKDPLNLVLSHLASGATKGETRKIVSALFPVGLDSSGKNALIRSLQSASTPEEVKSILAGVDAGLSSQVGNIAPLKTAIKFSDQTLRNELLPAKAQATKTITVPGEKTTLADVLMRAGNNANSMSLTGAIGNKLSNSGQKLIAKEFRLNPTQQANFAKLHGEEATSVIRRNGIKSPEDVQAKIQPLQNAFDSTVSSIPAVSKTQLEAGLKKVYEPLLKSPALFEQGLGGQIKQQADELLKLAKKGALPADKVNELRKTFDAAVNYTQRGAPEYNVIKKTADALRGTLQAAADKAGIKTADGMSFKEVGKELRKLYGIDEVVGKQQYLGSGSLPLGLTGLLGGGLGAGIAGGPAGALGGAIATKLVNSGTGRRVAANTVLKTGEKLATKAAKNTPYSIGDITKRVAPVGLAQALGGYLSSPNSDNATMSPTTTNPTTNAITNELYQNTPQMSSGASISPENYQRAVVADLQATGGKNLDTLKALYDQFGPQQQKPLNSTAAGVVADTQTGLTALGNLSDALTQSNANSPLLGGLRAANPFDTNAQSLQAQVATAKQIVGKALEGGVLRKEDEVKYAKLLPTMRDSDAVAQFKIQQLQQLISSRLQNYLSSLGSGSGGADQATLASALGI